MSWEIRLEPEATGEIAATSLWYDQRQDGVGDTFAAEVWEQIRGLDRFPNAGTPVHGVGGTVVVRQVRLRRFPFLVVYVVSDDVIRVLAVAHEKQQPGYWSDRL